MIQESLHGVGRGFEFGTKAGTLDRMKQHIRSARILDLYYFRVQEWTSNSREVWAKARTLLDSSKVVIRSSAIGEDSKIQSMAGAFRSVLNVNLNDFEAFAAAVGEVIESYKDSSSENEVLVQPFIAEIAVSGVITTYALTDGAPYCVINYDDESTKTDTITGGTGVSKTVMIHRKAKKQHIDSSRVQLWYSLAEELENICDGLPLDIEFGETSKSELILFQVRPLVRNENWNEDVRTRVADAQRYIEDFIVQRSQPRLGVLGSRSIFGEMPDWNPAEMIGTNPRPLAFSLYHKLITSEVWRQARERMGYRDLPNEALMVNIGGRPYIDVRNSFNSFLPAGLDERLGWRLVDAWLDRLDQHPEFHDKVEFEIAHTAMDFRFDENFDARYGELFSAKEKSEFRSALVELTIQNLQTASDSSLSTALDQIKALRARQLNRRATSEVLSEMDCLVQIEGLLKECSRWGTLPFSIIARHAFIAEALLRSAAEKSAFSAERLLAFKQSLTTVMGEMAVDFHKVTKGELGQEEFKHLYGHLRPGTYDLLSLRYDQRSDLFDGFFSEPPCSKHPFELSHGEAIELNQLLGEAGLRGVSAEDLMEYSRAAIVGREYAKFVFTKNISDALELLVRWGERIGLTREQLSYLKIEEVLSAIHTPVLENHRSYFERLSASGLRSMEMTRSLHLSYLIRDIRDVYVVPLHRALPNFVTRKKIIAPTVSLSNRVTKVPDLKGKIVFIENADPGFDWIFTREVAGLVTKFGGSNSHMTIRCAEFGLPAAIGCGEQTFERLLKFPKVELNCADKVLRPYA